MPPIVVACVAFALVALVVAEDPRAYAQSPPQASQTEVEIRGAVEPAPPGVRLFSEAAVIGATSREPFRWDQGWDGVRFGDFDHWTAIHDCAVLQDLLTSADPDNLYVVGIQEWVYYSGCIADGLLKLVQPAEASHFSARSPLVDVVERLDMLSFRSSFARIHRDHLRWLEMPQAFRVRRGVFEFESTSMSLETDDWYYALTLLAAGDWTGDGLEDVLVEFLEDARIGSYFAVSPLILEAPDPDGPLIAHEGEELLRSLLLAERAPVPELKPKH